MGFNLGMACSGCIYIVLVTMMYFNKKRISTYENKIYGHLLLVSVLQIIMGIEDEFHIQIPDDAADNIITVADAVNQIKSAL